ncbi:MAG: hypothetical protein K8T89_07990 [Planctomycetes bacterium]|nr:hypothetical protein [Planctomycetota bacterium]
MALTITGCKSSADSSKNAADASKNAADEREAKYKMLEGDWTTSTRGQDYVGFKFIEEANFWSNPKNQHHASTVERMKDYRGVIFRIDVGGPGIAGETGGFKLEGDTITFRRSLTGIPDQSWKIRKLEKKSFVLENDKGVVVEYTR